VRAIFSICNPRGWGEKLSPMSREEALEWAEQYLDEKTIEEHFGDDIKDV